MSEESEEQDPTETTPNRIVVGVDGSDCSVQALSWALREAMRSGAEVEAVLVWSDPWALGGPPSLIGAGKEQIARLNGILDGAVKSAIAVEKSADAVRVTKRLLPGQAPQVLAKESASAKLLVVGTRGLTGLGRWMLGSVSQRCAQLSQVPIVIVPPANPERHESCDST
ncbi:MAG: universal stress protein [Acidimicrobiales bacterium]